VLRFGLVAGSVEQRVRLILDRGSEARILTTRIELEVTRAGAAPGATVEARREAGRRVDAASRAVGARAERVDVATLWEIVSDAGEDAAPGHGLQDLAALALEDDSGEAQAAVALALLAEGIRFVRRGSLWEARSPAAVGDLEYERQRIAMRQRERSDLFAAMREAAGGAAFEPTGGETERHYLAAVETLAVEEDAATPSVRDLALEALEASGLRFDRPHEGAFRLARALGRFASDDENLQLRRYRLSPAFPEEVVEHARLAAERGFDRAGRSDLTGTPAVSIDSASTREIDDLLSLEHLRRERWRLGIHIADPTDCVRIDDPVDREAMLRALTHYMPDAKILMLPAVISEGACSLIEGEERAAVSFLVDLDRSGALLDYTIERSIVRCHARLDYAGADSSVGSGGGGWFELLRGLTEIAVHRRRLRIAKGAIPLLTPEADVRVDASGVPQLERLEARSPSRSAVSEAMILVGEIAAACCRDAGLPAIYRRQAIPEHPPDVPEDGIVDPVQVHAARRKLKRAAVGVQPGPHAALGLEAYAQVTSPLRRFQDLAVQRQLGGWLKDGTPPYDAAAIQRIAATTETAEADARRAERAADEYWLLRYLEAQIGATVDARVVAVEPRPIVRLDETLYERVMPSLTGVAAGEAVRVRIERVNPRARLLVLAPAR
jgi:exoribonuclease-2